MNKKQVCAWEPFDGSVAYVCPITGMLLYMEKQEYDDWQCSQRETMRELHLGMARARRADMFFFAGLILLLLSALLIIAG